MNPQILLSALRARYRVLLLVLGATVLAALALTMILPKTYVATVSLFVDGKDDQSMGAPAIVQARERTGYMQTQVDLMTSQTVAQKVVSRLGLADSPEVKLAYEKDTGGRGTIESWLVEDLLTRRVKVDTSQSSVIRLMYSADKPEDAANGANAFAQAYMDTVLALRVEPSRQTAAWFDEQLKGLRAGLEKAQERLTSYQKDNGITSLDERFDVENVALANLTAQLARTQGHGDESGQGASLPLENSASAIAHSNPLVQGLHTDFSRAEAKLAEMSAQFGSNHPQYRRQLAETQSLRDKLNREIKQIVEQQGDATSNRRSRAAELRHALASQQQKVLAAKQQRNALATLMRDVEIAQQAYATAMQRAVVSKVESRASLTNVNLLSAAVAPYKPVRPRTTLNMALSVVVGLLLGLSTIYLLEKFDRRVRTIADLDNDLHVPVLAELNMWQPAQHRLLGRPSAEYVLPAPG